MDELMPRHYYDPVRPTRGTRKRMAQIEQEAAVRRAAMEAAGRDALRQVEAQEQIAQARAALRAKGTYDLSEYAKHRATQLNHAIAVESAGNPRLEQIHRSFEQAAAITTQQIIYHYGAER